MAKEAPAEIVVDCTELFNTPINTGIQRVVRSLLRHWPREGVVRPIVSYLRKDGVARVPQRAIDFVLSSSADAGDFDATQRQLEPLMGEDAGRPPPAALHFIPELFYDRFRCDFYQRRFAHRHALAMLAYDFLPYSRPDLFSLRSTAEQMDYLRLIRRATYVAHISHDTQEEYVTRIRRGSPAPHSAVLGLGADGILAEAQSWRPSRRGFVAIGSLDRRKNQHLIFEAFEALWRDGHDAPLTLIGKAFASTDLGWMERARAHPQFRWLDNASDEAIAAEIEQARCSIYVSEVEGYGLPPLESLRLGLPVIATARLPSIRALDNAGIVRLESVSAESIRSAVLSLLDDSQAARLWTEAAAAQLPSWADFAAQTAAWLTELATPRPPDASATSAAAPAAAP